MKQKTKKSKTHWEREKIGETEVYRDHSIDVRYLGPDLMAEVDGVEINSFYVDAEAARRGARRYIDQVEKEAGK